MVQLLKKLPKENSTQSNKHLDVPFSIMMLKKCANYHIDGMTIKSLHFYDLQALIVSLDIDKIKELLESYRRAELQKKGIGDVTKISGNEALKLFGREVK